MSDKHLQPTETPIILIERDDEPAFGEGKEPPRPTSKWWWTMAWAFFILFAIFAAAVGYKIYSYYYHIGVPISVSPSANIRKLKTPVAAEPAEVRLTRDSILGVALDFYALHGLRAEISFTEPDTTDLSVYFYCRSADFKADGSYIGSLVVQGKEWRKEKSRLGYMAMQGDGMVIGVSRNDRVKDFVQAQGGSFFRQFILVSDGVIPARFYLHGKVERRAIGRIGNRLYFIATRHKETLWDFADALREYGFIDAIYITGGNDYSFYRSQDGVRHDIGNPKGYPHHKKQVPIPWLIFRKR